MELPESILGGGRFSGLRQSLSPWMNISQGKVPPHVAKIPDAPEQLAEHRLGLAAVGALEVTVFDERDCRVLGPANVVVVRIDGDGEVDDSVGCAENSAESSALWQ